MQKIINSPAISLYNWLLASAITLLVASVGVSGYTQTNQTGTTASTSSSSQASHVPPEGFVPNAATAIKIAEAVLVPIYGEQKIRHERPFTATLEGDVWTVSGTFPPHKNARVPTPEHPLTRKEINVWATSGGAALVEISKQDGRILRVTHGK